MIDENLLLEIVDNQGWQFPLNSPLVLDSKLARDNAQLYLKLTQFINQDGLCLCLKPLAQDAELHHALITRKDVQGIADQSLIHSSYNTVLLHQYCHKNIRRSLCFIYLVDRFGYKNITNWYQNTQAQMRGSLRNVESFNPDFILPK